MLQRWNVYCDALVSLYRWTLDRPKLGSNAGALEPELFEIPKKMSNKAILCVDDELIILETLVEQLEKKLGSEYIYETAETGKEGLEVIEELVNDNVDILIIVSDWLMPGMKGDEFLIKVHQQFPEIVTVLLTGQANEESIIHAKRSANLHACLFKPWSEEELVRIIKTGLGKL